jgi:SRSO17 transposase
VVGDTNYGKHLSFRSSLRDLDEPYVLGVEPTRFVVIPEETEIIDPDKAGPGRKHAAFRGDVETETPTEVADRVGDHEDWTRVYWNQGTKEALSGEFYRERVRVVKRTHQRWVTDETGWLLVKNCEDDDDQERDVRAWFCWELDEASLEELVSWAQLRWTVERFHQDIKQELGADEYQGRTWKGFHHHLAVVMVAHAFVASHRLRTGIDRTGLASFESVVRMIVRESAIQRLIDAYGFDRAKATAVALDMLTSYSDW